MNIEDLEDSYEEATIYTSPNTEQKPNFGDAIPPRGAALAAQQKRLNERAAHRDENRRYGEAISEHGFGGETVGLTHTTTSTHPANTTATSVTTGTSTGGGGGGGGGVGGRGGGAGAGGERHKSYSPTPEMEEKEIRDRRKQGYGEGSGVGG
ncbi:hypothetical protein VE03_00860 [Pseudogymnoascus sp. 23342-1-I1]|nr:hypothetical protein VE03_00860 [Pseudogymnoascus sp. 23342-1-I1]